MAELPASDRLIVALDVDHATDAMKIVQSLGDTVSFYKVGLQLFLPHGMPFVKELIAEGKKVFLDLKIDDTPRTVEAAVQHATQDHGVQFFTLQGNDETARAARRGRGDTGFPKFLQVTYLSSWSFDDWLAHMHFPDEIREDLRKKVSFSQIIENRAREILAAGCEGVIASGESVEQLRKVFPDAIIVTPGIRPEGSGTDDHKRAQTPYEAIARGANYLVVGRPIRNELPLARLDTAKRIIDDIRRGLEDFPQMQGSPRLDEANNR